MLTAQTTTFIDERQEIVQVNDTIWQLSTYRDFNMVDPDFDLDTVITVIVPELTVRKDSAGIVDLIYTSAYNNMNQYNAIRAKNIEIVQLLSSVTTANTLIASITGDASNFFEEASKRLSSYYEGRWISIYPTEAGNVRKVWEMTLVTNVAHPDGRFLRLTNTEDATEFYNVLPNGRRGFRIANWPYGQDSFVLFANDETGLLFLTETTNADRTDRVSRFVKRK